MSQRLRFLLEIDGVIVEITSDYVDFIRRLRVRLGVRASHNIPALAVQADPPPGFCDIIIEVLGEAYSGSVRFRLRVDNLYLLGYQMSGGQWLEFDRAPNTEPLINGSRQLGFTCSYVSLVTPLPHNQGLTSVTIGLNVLGATIQTLATSAIMSERARGLIVVIFMFCEATRFSPVLDHISNHRGGFNIPRWMVNLVRSWGILSGALLRADAYPDEPFMLADEDVLQLPEQNMEIRTLADIVSVLGILLGLCFTRPRASMSLTALNNQQPQCFVGLPLLDVFSIEISGISGDDPRIFGTITISNGLSTRIVYNLTRDISEYVGLYIEPNGPPEAIPAYGEILIDVNLSLTYDRELRRVLDNDETEASNVLNRVGPARILVDKTVTWDAFNLGSPYDQVITAPLASATIGSLSINYVVQRNAVAATVTVVLREAYEDTSEVYGRIHAFYDSWPQARSILFHRKSGDYVSVERGHDIPLQKSVVPVPLRRNSLKIQANLTEYDPIADDPIVYHTFDFPIPNSLPASSFEDGPKTDRNQIRIMVSWTSGYSSSSEVINK
ncbi:hypothetical protein CASFOL_038175 [Castilleja foliolosa]|uniref:rRNA N-glycosylase n=1 Tax=Castilleja foliolosa TaxID=1961234 RepID=A0ABD3BKW2_9LAMI